MAGPRGEPKRTNPPGLDETSYAVFLETNNIPENIIFAEAPPPLKRMNQQTWEGFLLKSVITREPLQKFSNFRNTQKIS